MSTAHSAGPDPLAWDLQDRLHKAMRIGRMTSSQIGVALGIHRNTVSNYLAGRSPIDRRTIVAWALACGVPVVAA